MHLVFPSLHKNKITGLVLLIHLLILFGFVGIHFFRTQQSIPMELTPLFWVSNILLGLFSFVCVFFLLLDACYFILSKGKKFHSKSQDHVHQIDEKKRHMFYSGALMAAVLLTGKSIANAIRIPDVKRVTIPIAGLPQSLEGLSVVQITDVHIGPTIGLSYVQSVVDKINTLNADIIAITGDLADGFVHQLKEAAAPLAQLKSKYGLFYVTGNHEYYWGASQWTSFMEGMGAVHLGNAHKVLRIGDQDVLVAGVTDLSAGRLDPSWSSSPQKALEQAPDHVPLKILLAHQPKSAFQAVDCGFHVQLSGHTHGGQFWPWTWVVRLVQPFYAGLTRYKNMWIYVSRGTGYWGPPSRLGSDSEITKIVFQKA